MANVKISGLPAAAALTGAEQVPVVQGGVTKRTTVSDLSGPHETDAIGAHPASAVSFTPSGLIIATDVQAALAELDAEKAVVGHDHSGTSVSTTFTSGLGDGLGSTPVTTQSSDATKGPWELAVHEYANLGGGGTTWNAVGRFGYNVLGEEVGEPRWHLTLESNYKPDPATRWLEGYLESTASGVTVRPFMYIIDTATGRVTSSVFRVSTAAQGFQIRNDIDETDIAQFYLGGANFYGNPAADSQVTVKCGATRAATFQMEFNGAATFKILTTGTTITQLIQGGFNAFQVCGRSDMGGVGFGDNPAAVGGVVAIKMQNAASGGYAAFMAAARTTPVAAQDLFRATDSAYAVWSRINYMGYFMTRKVAAPADAELVAGEMALWFDATNGAAKLMVKAKEAGGTVRTGSLALT